MEENKEFPLPEEEISPPLPESEEELPLIRELTMQHLPEEPSDEEEAIPAVEVSPEEESVPAEEAAPAEEAVPDEEAAPVGGFWAKLFG